MVSHKARSASWGVSIQSSIFTRIISFVWWSTYITGHCGRLDISFSTNQTNNKGLPNGPFYYTTRHPISLKNKNDRNAFPKTQTATCNKSKVKNVLTLYLLTLLRKSKVFPDFSLFLPIGFGLRWQWIIACGTQFKNFLTFYTTCQSLQSWRNLYLCIVNRDYKCCKARGCLSFSSNGLITW
jgi:hypothetical protein